MALFYYILVDLCYRAAALVCLGLKFACGECSQVVYKKINLSFLKSSIDLIMLEFGWFPL